MHLTKRQSVAAAVGLLALFFAFATLITQHRRSTSGSEGPGARDAADTDRTPAATSLDDTSAKSKVILNEFRRSETKDGKKLWEVTAKHGQYFPETNTAQLSEARLLFYRANGEEVALDAKRAELFFDSFSLERANLSGGLTLNYKDELSLKTATASFRRDTNSIHAPGAVRIKHKLAKIRGEDLQADLTLGQITLGRKVDTILFARNGKDKGSQ